MPDTTDLGETESLSIPLPENFYDPYTGRVAAQDQDLSIEKTMLMGYDLKMFDDSLAALKEPSIRRMNPGQRQKYLDYYRRIKTSMDSTYLAGNALTEWKYTHYMQDYLATAISLDRNVGRLINYLEENDLLDNTLIVYTSDQGFYLGEHGWFDKRFMYEESMRTPLIIRYPPMIQKGTSLNSLVMNLDLAPTFLDLAEVSVPPDMQGKSLLPLFSSTTSGPWRSGVYYHYYEFPGEHHVYRHFGIRTDRFKLIRFYGPKDFWELYDLENDPDEMKNLAQDEQFHAQLTSLKQELLRLILQYEDKEALAIFNNK
jgi:arylsulfatase A-like enzyme